MVADVPVGVLLSGGIDSSIVVALLAEMGQKDLKTFSIGFESEGGESGDEFDYSDLVAKTYGTDHVKFTVPKHETDDALAGAVAAMAEPMVSHDVVAFYLLSREVSKSIKVVQSGQGADEILGGYDWYPPLAGIARDAALDSYQKAFFDRPHSEVAQLLTPEALVDDDVSRAFVAEHFGRPGADSAVDAALRLDTTIMLVDDPVKRVDNMTMAWGLEARVPFLDHEFVETMGACPPEYKLADGGKGVLKAARARRAARRDHRPQEGLLPGAGDPPALGPGPGAGAGRPDRPGRHVAGPVPGRRGGDDARRPELGPHQPRRQRVVAGGPARDVAAGARHHVGTVPARGIVVDRRRTRAGGRVDQRHTLLVAQPLPGRHHDRLRLGRGRPAAGAHAPPGHRRGVVARHG